MRAIQLVASVAALLASSSVAAADPETAIVRAVNDTRDNDTIATIVGAAVGALHGRETFPDRWIENLTGRVTADGDDGRAFELIEQARERWWDST